MDNASKTSSGYDDEEFNDSDEDGVTKNVTYDKIEKKIDEILVISDDDDDDDDDVWTICSNSDDEYYDFNIDDIRLILQKEEERT